MKQQEVRNALAESIRQDVEMMKEITQDQNDEWLNMPMDFRKKYTVKDMVEAKVHTLTMKHESNFRSYVTFETEVSI